MALEILRLGGDTFYTLCLPGGIGERVFTSRSFDFVDHVLPATEIEQECLNQLCSGIARWVQRISKDASKKVLTT